MADTSTFHVGLVLVRLDELVGEHLSQQVEVIVSCIFGLVLSHPLRLDVVLDLLEDRKHFPAQHFSLSGLVDLSVGLDGQLAHDFDHALVALEVHLEISECEIRGA